MKFYTLNDKFYFNGFKKYQINWESFVGSSLQYKVKQFIRKYWENDIVCEEFPCRPFLKNHYRIDLFNFTRKIAIEVAGSQHIRYTSHFHKSIDDFYDAVERDHKKKLWCSKNDIQLIEIYPRNLPLTEKWLTEKYPKINWK